MQMFALNARGVMLLPVWLRGPWRCDTVPLPAHPAWATRSVPTRSLDNRRPALLAKLHAAISSPLLRY